jgi:hypothetical protein
MTPGEDLELTVGAVWREERVSCPHPDILRAYLAQSLEAGAMGFVTFHLRESLCPYCDAVLEDLRLSEADARQAGFEHVRERLLRSTVTALRGAAGA